jgi:predicted Holliday junction resolvase-like endonuclease
MGRFSNPIPKEIEQILGHLSGDNKIVGECPACGEKSPLPGWNLFYRDMYPAAVKDAIDAELSRPAEAKTDYDKLKLKLTTLAAQRSVVVNIGKIVEEIAPGLSTFPYHRADCRSLLDPIDYVVFDGLAKDGKVSNIHFLDVKTGASKLNEHQKQVKDAIEKKRVEFTLY